MSSYNGESGYLQLVSDVLHNGEEKKGRNGFTLSSFGKMITFDNIDKSFPLLTTKKMFVKGIIEELLWFLRGSTDSKELENMGVNIWKGNSSREYLDSIGLNKYEEGILGPVYGYQWRCFNGKYPKQDNGVDQIHYLLTELLKPDNSRRAVLTAWNPCHLKEMALPPCHMMYTFFKCRNGLSCMMNMRSSDLFLGLPFNIASTAVLTCIIAKVLHISPYTISIAIADAHIYEEHIDSVDKQLKNETHDLPRLEIKKDAPSIEASVDEKIRWINDLSYNDFVIYNYISSGPIKAVMK